VETNRDALRVAFQHGLLPVHHTCHSRHSGASLEWCNGIPMQITQFLVETNRDALRVAFQHGLLPAHHACHSRHSGASLEWCKGIPMRSNSSPQKAMFSCILPPTPTTSAGQRWMWCCIWSSFVPTLSKARAMEDCLPYHCAPIEIVPSLVQQYPESVTLKDKDGRLALRWACWQQGCAARGGAALGPATSRVSQRCQSPSALLSYYPLLPRTPPADWAPPRAADWAPPRARSPDVNVVAWLAPGVRVRQCSSDESMVLMSKACPGALVLRNKDQI
jgi:hypothetical protein